MNDLDEVLLSLLGSKELVDLWWETANKAFAYKTPQEVWNVEPEKVAQYVMGTFYRVN